MKKTIFVLLISIVLLSISSCASMNAGKDGEAAWAGIYHGVTPAASSSGIDVIVILNSNNTYKVSYRYIDKGDEVFNFTGTLSWDEKTKVITLRNNDLPPYYKVGKNYLLQLDMEGKEIKGSLSKNYKLQKVPTV